MAVRRRRPRGRHLHGGRPAGRLAQLITGDWTYGSEICWENLRVETYEQAGVMTYNKGLVITLPDGSEYQLTIVQSR